MRGSRHQLFEQSWWPAYRWITDQMRRRIGPPPENTCVPIWAWYQCEGLRKRPDLRSRGHVPPGERAVRIEFDCSDGAALLSDFSLWHFVLNYWYLPASEAEGHRFESELTARGLSFYRQKPLPDHDYHGKVVESWERIFDLDWSGPDGSEPKEEKSIQATVWEIALDQITDYRFFVGR